MPLSQYAGDPTKFPPTIGLIDDSVLRNASNLNVAPQGLADRTAFLGARILAAPGLDWQPAISGVAGQGAAMTGANSDTNGAVLWDETNGVWHVSYTFPTSPVQVGALYCQAGFEPASGFVLPYGSAQNYQIGGGFVSGLAQDPVVPTTYFAGLVFPGTTSHYIAKLDTTSGGGSPTWASSFPQIDASVTDIQMLAFRNVVLAAVAGNAAFSNVLQTPDHGTTWHSPVNAGATYVSGVGPWLLKANPVQALAVPGFSGATTYWSSADGVFWTAYSFGTLLSSSGLAPIGLAWGSDAIGPCWILAAGAGGGPGVFVTTFFRSGDGINWTTVSTVTTAAIRDLVAVGPLWVATTWDTAVVSPLGAVGASYVVVSTDGAVTWRRSQGSLTTNLGAVPRYRVAKLATNGRQILLYNGAQIRFSRVFGTSPMVWT